MLELGGPAGRMMKQAQGQGLIRGRMASGYSNNPEIAAPVPAAPSTRPAVAQAQTPEQKKRKKRIPRYMQAGTRPGRYGRTPR